eukprot:CAMPEP_0119271484 /NCGR_PEP_ID=MMETSP1329-20130426/8062_1 /TAXON_ID=114041 /ORGANISM="Genus nov. species nov., Strain RCC1024" /LENGTH=76 /DNA_ID=CAMNT_0007271533 /DNA_START=81 /DNA_END=308 /DNA_ORIENTATION=-
MQRAVRRAARHLGAAHNRAARRLATAPADDRSLAAAWRALPEPHRAGMATVTCASAALNFGFGAVVPVLPQYALGL